MKFISKANFIKYLKKNKNARYKCSSENCPLAKATGYRITGLEYGHDLLDEYKDLPIWAKNFVDVFDSDMIWDRKGNDYNAVKVPYKAKSAKRALYIMENIV